MKNNIVVFDLDNVIANSQAKLQEDFEKYFGIDLTQERFWDKVQGKWYLIPELYQRCALIWRMEFFKNLAPMPGLDYFKDIYDMCRENSIRPLIVTAPAPVDFMDLTKGFLGCDEKYYWVSNNLPYFPIENLVITMDKNPLTSCSLMVVEDDLNLLKKISKAKKILEGQGVQDYPKLLCYSQLWNSFGEMNSEKEKAGIISVSSWSEIHNQVTKLISSLKESEYGVI